MANNIDPFEQIENDSDILVQTVRDIVAGAIVIGGTFYLVWFWFLSVQ